MIIILGSSAKNTSQTLVPAEQSTGGTINIADNFDMLEPGNAVNDETIVKAVHKLHPSPAVVSCPLARWR